MTVSRTELYSNSDSNIITDINNKTISVGKNDLTYIPEEIVIDDNTTTSSANVGGHVGDDDLDAGSNVSFELSQMAQFAISGNRKKLQEAISAGDENINNTDNMGRTPLIYSVLVEQMECVILLLKSGADPDIADGDGRTALHWAAYQGNHKLVKLIIAKCKDKITCDKEGRTPLHLSISHDNIKVMQIILKHLTAKEVDVVDHKHMTPLCWAVFYERIEHTKLLLKHHASTTTIDNEGRSVLHWTTQNKLPTLIALLLEQGRCSINFLDKEGRTPLHMAVGYGSFNIVQYFLSLPDITINQQDSIKRTPLHWAAVLGHKPIVELLLSSGADYSVCDCNGARALHYAAQNNNYEVVISMLNLQKITDEPDNEDRTALMWAAVKGNAEVVKVLLERKCTNVNAIDKRQQTALHMSCQAGHLNCVKLLLAFQADVSIVDKQHHIPLFLACASGHADVVSELLGHGSMSNLDHPDLDGRTPLHYAAMVDRRNVIEILIKHKLNPNTKDNAGRQPLHIAAYGGFVHCMSVLLENGAHVNVQDNDGRTALHMACRSGALDAVKLLVSRYEAKINVLDTSEPQLTALDCAFFADQQDVAHFLMENRAITATALKDSCATRIQAICKGYLFRKDFAKNRVLLVKHEKFRKRDMTGATFSSGGSENGSVKLNPLWSSEANDLPPPDQPSSFATQHSSVISARGPNSLSVEFPLRKRSRSQTSLVSSVSLISSARSEKTKPTGEQQQQGPKFYDSTANNPFSLNRVSRTLHPFPDSNLTVSHSRKAKSVTGGVVGPFKPDSPNKRLSLINLHDSKMRRYSSKSATGNMTTESLTAMSDSGRLKDGNLYQNSYSRHVSNIDNHSKRTLSDSSESTFFRAKPNSSYPTLPQISVPNSRKSDDTSSTRSSIPTPKKSNNLNNSNKNLMKSVPRINTGNQPSSHGSQPTSAIQPQHGAVYSRRTQASPSPPTSSSGGVIFTSKLPSSEGDNKPWNVFRRDQKRINIIRLKTEAAIKIQLAYRSYRETKIPKINIMDIEKLPDNIPGRSKQGSPELSYANSFDSGRITRSSDNSYGEYDSSIIGYEDSETDSFDTAFSIDDMEGIPDEETLQEVAALVIQATWRQYVKNKLMLEVKRSKTPSDGSINNGNSYFGDEVDHNKVSQHHDSGYKGQEDFGLAMVSESMPTVVEVPTAAKHHRKRFHKRTSKQQSISTPERLVVKDDENNDDISMSSTKSKNKKKLVPSQSFPLMQSIYRESLRKKRSKRFSIKKRILTRGTALTSSHEDPTMLTHGEVNLVSVSPSLARNEREAVKNGKNKVFLKLRRGHHSEK